MALAAVIWVALADVAAGCSSADPIESPLEIGVPLASEEAHILIGFGIQAHPIFNIPKQHQGVDWHAPLGTPVIAAGRGRVTVAGADREGDYGNRVIIDHEGPWRSVYGHLDKVAVRVGDCIQAGAVIGTVGTTGATVSPVIHFEVRCGGQAVDPMSLPVKPRKGTAMSCNSFVSLSGK